MLARFLHHYYRQLPDEDAEERPLEDVYAAGLAHFRLGRVRCRGDVLVDVLSPDFERDGWQTDRSILLFVTDDIPFLVDTVRMALHRFDLGIHLIVHPMLAVDRSGDGAITSVELSTGNGDAAHVETLDNVEAWTQVEFDRCPPRRPLRGRGRGSVGDLRRPADRRRFRPDARAARHSG